MTAFTKVCLMSPPVRKGTVSLGLRRNNQGLKKISSNLEKNNLKKLHNSHLPKFGNEEFSIKTHKCIEFQ